MRLIGNLENEKKAFVFYSVLLKEGIESTYEKSTKTGEEVSIWIYDEDQINRAMALFDEYHDYPESSKFANIPNPPTPPQPPNLSEERKREEAQKKEERLGRPWQKRMQRTPRNRKKHPLTSLIILLCVFLYFWNGAQQVSRLKADGKLALEIGWTPIQQMLMFDYPKSTERIDALLEKYSLDDFKSIKELPTEEQVEFAKAAEIPTWRGVLAKLMSGAKEEPESPVAKGPLFGKIKQGEVWRLFTPCLLHASLLHILFNMAWAWILLKQVEERLPNLKIILLILAIGIVSNIAQYMMSGANFLGFSGVVAGLVGFIWVRQKRAPWEGYPLNRSTIIFILVYIGAMFALELFSLAMALFTSKQDYSPNIANTAHIIGGLFGAFLGRLPFFSRGTK
ncbi:MAG: Rhomboid protease GlpG [Chlamydiae bacterium]|nr:Rhomboid protease GlpG [Chlamydiota bacterium]